MTFIIQKVYDMGASDPFVARMMIQITEFRDSVFHDDAERRRFDESYEPILASLRECRDAMILCEQLILDHKERIASKQIVSFQNKALTITEPIQQELNRHFKDFFIKGKIALNGIVRISKFPGCPISFFGKDRKKFKEGSQKFLQQKPGVQFEKFIQMLEGDWETWYPTFNEIRRQIEHAGFNLPGIRYHVDRDNNVGVSIPTINNKGIIETLNLLWNNLFQFCEDVIISQFGFKLEPPLIIACIPEDQRDPQKPVKYKLWVQREYLEQAFPKSERSAELPKNS